MNDNTPIGYGPDKHEQNRQSIKIWFRGQVTTIGKAEQTLLREAIDTMIAEQGISHECKQHPFRFSNAFYMEFKYLSDSEWRYNYLESIGWDRWQKDYRFKEANNES